MTIQIPNPGTGNGETGDNEFVMWTKVKDNFNNQDHAASKLVGTSPGQVPLAQDIKNLAFSIINAIYTSNENCNNFTSGTVILVISSVTNAPPTDLGDSTWLITTRNMHLTLDRRIQIAYGYESTAMSIRRLTSSGWSPWELPSSLYVYKTTTASGANVAVSSAGKLMRSTSSERYKDIIADLELDDVSYANAMQLAPIVYRSTADADNPAYHYYSFSAEALGAYDPAFTLWRETETVTDAEGNTTEQPLDERQAEGINLNAIVAFLHATNVKQSKLIADQAEAIETLTKRIDDMTVE